MLRNIQCKKFMETWKRETRDGQSIKVIKLYLKAGGNANKLRGIDHLVENHFVKSH